MSDRLLVLDLDETLIHAPDQPLDRACDFQVGPYPVYVRPHVDTFLTGASAWFDLAVWSSASHDYVTAIASRILPEQLTWRFIWSRDRCTARFDPESYETNYIKDLKKILRLGYDRSHVLMVDDTPKKLMSNYGNAIYVRPFEGATEDSELQDLLRYLASIHNESDYRSLEKRGWRNSIP